MRARSANRIALDDVRTMGGKDLVLKRLVNHYKAISNAKPEIKIGEPKLFNKNKKNLQFNPLVKEEYFNVRQTYKGVCKVKPTVDTKIPFTFKMGKSKKDNPIEKFEDFEHVRRLNAMQKRIQSIGKPQERKKNINDPISNPIFFFKKPGDTRGIKLVSLEKFSENLRNLNKEDKNKNLLNEIVDSLNNPKHERKSFDNSKLMTKRPDTGLNKSESDKKIYTHIHIDPEEFLNKHINERVKAKKEEEKELLNFTRNSSSTLNKSRKTFKNPIKKNTLTTNLMTYNIDFNLDKSENKIVFPLFDSSHNDSKENFHTNVIQYIVTKRIFKDYDMDMFLKQLILRNKKLISEDEIKEIFNNIKAELEK